VLHDKYLFPKMEADALASFLTPMLRLHPDKRAKASELVHHNWLDGVVVQGELDVIRRAERDEMNAAGIAPPPPGVTDPAMVMAVAFAAEAVAAAHARPDAHHETKEEKMQRTQSEADALKPVEDIHASSAAASSPPQ
jgi:serine/threonine-protein kinase SRPK3